MIRKGMKTLIDSITPCCGDQPTLRTWDEKEMRSLRCIHCGRQTGSHFMRLFAYEEWEQMMEKVVSK